MTTPSSKQPEDLVAYLDGELNDAEAAGVEDALAEDPQVRQQIEKLTRTWELLDLLPAARASPEFTEKTLAVIGTQAKPAGEADTEFLSAGFGRRMRASSGRWTIRGAGLVGLLVAAAIGFNTASRRNAEPVDTLLTELPLIERLDQYQAAGRVEFLQQLASSGLFDEQSESELK